MTDTDAGKRLSDADKNVLRLRIEGKHFGDYVKVSAGDLEALLDETALTANRRSVSEDRARAIIEQKAVEYKISALFAANPILSIAMNAAIQQAVSECSGGGGEEMREAAARLAEARFVVWGRDKTGMVAAEAVASVCENIARAIRALPLPLSPVKESRDAEYSRPVVLCKCGKVLETPRDYAAHCKECPDHFTKSTPHQGGNGNELS